jgi:hypothetical protein
MKLKKKFHLKRVAPEVQRRARRDLVILLGSMIFVVFIPLFLMVRLTIGLVSLGLLKGTLKLIDALFVLIYFLCSFTILAILSSAVWMIILSFFVTVDEWKELDAIPAPYFPVLTPIYKKMSEVILELKINRDVKKSKKP